MCIYLFIYMRPAGRPPARRPPNRQRPSGPMGQIRPGGPMGRIRPTANAVMADPQNSQHSYSMYSNRKINIIDRNKWFI